MEILLVLLIWVYIGYVHSPAIFARKGYSRWLGALVGAVASVAVIPLWYLLPHRRHDATVQPYLHRTALRAGIAGGLLSLLALTYQNFNYELLLDPLSSRGLSEVVIQFMLVNAILGMSIYITLYGGMFSLANAGFMAIGAYVAVILTQTYEWGFWQAVIAGAAAAGIIAIPIGLPVLRLRDIYLAIATIGFGEVVRISILNFDRILKEGYTLLEIESDPPKITNGALGITGIPVITTTADLILVIIILSYLLIRLHNSRFGRALAAIRQDENVAANLGINVVYYKNVAFIMSAMVAGLAGGLHAHLIRIITPERYDFAQAVNILAYAVLGGTTTWFGPIIGGLVLTALPEMLRDLAEYTGLVTGIVLLIFIAYLPGGLGDPVLWRSAWRMVERVTQPPEAE